MKTCQHCGENKPLGSFRKGGAQCRDCRLKTQTTYARKVQGKPPRVPFCPARKAEYNRQYRLRTQWDMTVEEYDRRLAEQGGVCAMPGCEKPPSKDKRLAVDHDHETGVIRALLCHTCNNHLGVFERRRKDFEEYLAKYGA